MKREKHTKYIKDFAYYKIQYWDEVSICWADIPKTFPEPQKAENFVLTIGKKYRIGNKYRIMEVMRNGRKTFKTSE